MKAYQEKQLKALNDKSAPIAKQIKVIKQIAEDDTGGQDEIAQALARIALELYQELMR